MESLEKRKVIFYVVSVYLLTYALNLYVYLQGGYASLAARLFVPFQMFIPALVAAVLILKEKGKFKEYGLTFGGLKNYLLAYLLVISYYLIHSLVSFGLGLGRFVPLTEGFRQLAPDLQWPAWQIVLIVFILAPLQNLIFGFGEEFGWRGYLVNKLLPRGLGYTILVSGIIWGLWHAPVVLMGHNFPENPYAGVVVMTLATIPLGAIFLWLRLKSGSAVVVGFAHGVLNGTAFLGGAFMPTASLLWVNPVGLVGIPLLSLFAYFMFRLFPVEMPVGIKKENKRP
ncbi:MAG: CPBP family intramembrane metalloprotease [Syntrophomonadaceae bacterium]|nr:CPBP family intramembrane metalloprotease [Syntrophomonadaceae bacterium]